MLLYFQVSVVIEDNENQDVELKVRLLEFLKLRLDNDMSNLELQHFYDMITLSTP